MSSRLIHGWAATALVTSAVAIACHGRLDVPSPQSSSAGSSSSSGGSSADTDAGAQIPFEPVSARIYVGKVKNLMLGLPATEDEIAMVTADPTALKGMVDAWFVRPEAQAKLGTFFQKAFQQTQITQNDFFDQMSVDNLSALPVFQQAQESMMRTALKTIADAKPFTDTVTTHTFMMTPSLMAMYLAIDQSQVDDNGKITISLPMPDGSLSTTQTFWATYQPPVDPTAMPVVQNPILLADTMNPASPNFMHFAAAAPFTCSMPQVDDTGHVVVDTNGNAVKANVSYNQRKYANVTSAFLTLFGFAPKGFVNDPTDPNGARTRSRSTFTTATAVARSLRRASPLKTSFGAPSRCAWPTRARSSRPSTICRRCAWPTRSSSARRASGISRRPRSSPIGRRTTATKTATR
jgi:hypothetical protein